MPKRLSKEVYHDKEENNSISQLNKKINRASKPVLSAEQRKFLGTLGFFTASLLVFNDQNVDTFVATVEANNLLEQVPEYLKDGQSFTANGLKDAIVAYANRKANNSNKSFAGGHLIGPCNIDQMNRIIGLYGQIQMERFFHTVSQFANDAFPLAAHFLVSEGFEVTSLPMVDNGDVRVIKTMSKRLSMEVHQDNKQNGNTLSQLRKKNRNIISPATFPVLSAKQRKFLGKLKGSICASLLVFNDQNVDAFVATVEANNLLEQVPEYLKDGQSFTAKGVKDAIITHGNHFAHNGDKAFVQDQLIGPNNIIEMGRLLQSYVYYIQMDPFFQTVSQLAKDIFPLAVHFTVTEGFEVTSTPIIDVGNVSVIQ